MSQNLQPGDFLIFQLESGYALLRVLDVGRTVDDTIWHLAAYGDFFLDVETADLALENSSSLSISHPHIALTNRAFESTQVARMKNEPLKEMNLNAFEVWKKNPDREISDRSVRLMLGLR